MILSKTYNTNKHTAVNDTPYGMIIVTVWLITGTVTHLSAKAWFTLPDYYKSRQYLTVKQSVTHDGQDKMTAIFQTFLNAVSIMKTINSD